MSKWIQNIDGIVVLFTSFIFKLEVYWLIWCPTQNEVEIYKSTMYVYGKKNSFRQWENTKILWKVLNAMYLCLFAHATKQVWENCNLVTLYEFQKWTHYIIII